MPFTTFPRQDAASIDGQLARMFAALQNRPVSEMLHWTVDRLDEQATEPQQGREARAA